MVTFMKEKDISPFKSVLVPFAMVMLFTEDFVSKMMNSNDTFVLPFSTGSYFHQFFLRPSQNGKSPG